MYDLLIRNAEIAHPDGRCESGDLACQKGKIEKIEPSIDASARREIDAAGHLLLPGVIDPQVHFREPGAPHKEDLTSGSHAAVRGGVTSFLEMPNTAPPTINQNAIDDKLKRAAEKCVANYGFFVGATPDNLDALNNCTSVCGIKIFMGSSTGTLLVNEPKDLEKIFANGRRLIAVHAEDEARINQRTSELLKPDSQPDYSLHSEIRDHQCALKATRLALDLSTKYQRRLHILHLSTGIEVDLLRQTKPDWVSAEVIPNHLLLNTDHYEKLGSLVQMNPPIRLTSDNEKLWQGLKDGVIDIIATDHAPHMLEEKQQPYPKSPSGMPGVETSLPLMLTEMSLGKCTLQEIQRWMCSGPAQLYGIKNKGKIMEDWDADLAIVDIQNRRVLQNEDMFSRAGWTPYAGRELTGWIQHTIVGGQVAYSDGRVDDTVRGKALEFHPDLE